MHGQFGSAAPVVPGVLISWLVGRSPGRAKAGELLLATARRSTSPIRKSNVLSCVMEPESIEADLIRQLEEQLLRPEVRASADQVAVLLADGFVEFETSGRIYNKEQMIDLLQQEQGRRDQSSTITEFSVRRLAADVIVVTYRIVESRTIRSSIWKLTSRRWQMEFHQSTKSEII